MKSHLLLVLGTVVELLALSVPPRQPQIAAAQSAAPPAAATSLATASLAPCTPTITNSWNSQGPPEHHGTLIWFSGDVKTENVPADGTLIDFTQGHISFMAAGIYHRLILPNARVTFSSSASCTSTIFDPSTDTWVTTTPLRSGPIFVTGLAWPVPPGRQSSAATHVNFTGTYRSRVNPSGLPIRMRWSATAYSSVPTEQHGYEITPAACRQTANGNFVASSSVSQASSPWKLVLVGGGASQLNFIGSWTSSLDAVICP